MLLAQRDFEVVVLDRDAAPPDSVDDAWEHWSRRSVRANEPYQAPGPDRAALESLLACCESALG